MRSRQTKRGAFTLVEVMIAATISLVLIGLVVQIFSTVGAAATQTRSLVQVTDRLRTTRLVLREDLSNVTAEMLPPLRTDRAVGYFEYIEGPDGPIFSGTQSALDMGLSNERETAVADTTVGDPDDMLMFTAQASAGTFFYGRARAATRVVDGSGNVWVLPVDGMTQSTQAEICYFVRGNTLYRRVLLIDPTIGPNADGKIDPNVFLWSQYQVGANTANAVWDLNFYEKFDVSVRQEGGAFDLTSNPGGVQPPMLVANTLADLTLRQNRYGHQPWVYPFDVRFWDTRQWTNPATNVLGAFLGLPTLRECTFYTGTAGGAPPPGTQGFVARWPFPLFNPATPASTYLWGQPMVFNPAYTSNYLPGVTPPMFPYNTLPLIYPYPTTPPSGATAANYQPATTIPSTWTGRINLTDANGSVANGNGTPYDLWENAYATDQQDPLTGSIYAFSSTYQPPGWVNVDYSTRYADDVLLQHVLSFDVKAWDPTAPTIQITTAVGGVPPGTYVPGDAGYVQIINTWAQGGLTTLQTNLQLSTALTGNPSGGFTVAQGAYVDLNYLGALIQPFAAAGNTQMAQALSQVSVFAGPGIAQLSSGLGMLYDTGCFSYENDGIDQNANGIIDDFTNGLDDNGIGGVDDLTEVEGPVPYPVPLRGIQVKIRVFEPDSRQIREMTLTQDFLWE
jgi:hypothetical protein